MDNSVGHQKLTITFHKIGRSQAFGRFHLVDQRKSVRSHSLPSRKTVDDLDVGTQKSNVLIPAWRDLRFVHMWAPFNVHRNKISYLGNIRPSPMVYSAAACNPTLVQSGYLFVTFCAIFPSCQQAAHIVHCWAGYQKHADNLPYIGKLLLYFSHSKS